MCSSRAESERRERHWVFRGTRVPIRALFENLRDGATVEEFVEWFPGVGREQVLAVLDHEARQLAISATP